MSNEDIKQKEITECPECKSTDLLFDHTHAEIICKNCGLVIDESIMDMGPEWRSFDHEQREKRTRVGAPMTNTIHDKGLSTMIDWKNKDVHGNNIPLRNRVQWYRMRKWQRRIRVSNAMERNLAFALSELDRQASKLNIPRSIREDASVVYKEAAHKKLIRGRSMEGVIAASLYISCRRYKIPRSLDEVAAVARVTKKEVGRTYRFLTRELNIKLAPVSPTDFIPRFASELGVSGKVESRAIEIINLAVEGGYTSGRSPIGIAAAAIYIASIVLNEKQTQAAVANVSGVTEITIRNRYGEICENLEININE